MVRVVRAFSLVALALAACHRLFRSRFGHRPTWSSAPDTTDRRIRTVVPTAPTVLVTDANDHPVPGSRGNVCDPSGGGSVSPITQTTSATGLGVGRMDAWNAFARTRLPPLSRTSACSLSAMAIAPESGILCVSTWLTPAEHTSIHLRRLQPTPQAIDLLSLRGRLQRRRSGTDGDVQRAGELWINAPIFKGLHRVRHRRQPQHRRTVHQHPFTGASGSLGMDYRLGLYGRTRGYRTGVFQPAPQSGPGSGELQWSTVVLRVPMSLLGNDDGNFSIVV